MVAERKAGADSFSDNFSKSQDETTSLSILASLYHHREIVEGTGK